MKNFVEKGSISKSSGKELWLIMTMLSSFLINRELAIKFSILKYKKLFFYYLSVHRIEKLIRKQIFIIISFEFFEQKFPKMASKGKSKLAFTETAKLKKSTTIYENALDNAYYVEAEMKNGTRHLARILDCRLLKSINSLIYTQKINLIKVMHQKGKRRTLRMNITSIMRSLTEEWMNGFQDLESYQSFFFLNIPFSLFINFFFSILIIFFFISI